MLQVLAIIWGLIYQSQDIHLSFLLRLREFGIKNIRFCQYIFPKELRQRGIHLDKSNVCVRYVGLWKIVIVMLAENLNRAGLARIHACGHDSSVSGPRMTEATSMGEAGSERVDK